MNDRFSILGQSWWRAGAVALLVLAGGWLLRQTLTKAKPETATAEGKTQVAATPLLALLPSSETGIEFANQILEDEQHNVLDNINLYNGGGVCVGDFDADGLPDIYFVRCNGRNALYFNRGGFKFEEKAVACGVDGGEEGFESGAMAADVNADGLLDLFVCRAGPKDEHRVSRLYINSPDKPGTFVERAAEFGLADKGAVTGVNFFDYDGDGDLDCYLLNHPDNLALSNELLLQMDVKGDVYADLAPKQEHDSDRLYRNEGPKAGSPGVVTFQEVSQKAGIHNLGFGLSTSATDLNRDGYTDIYVANDFLQPDNLYLNDGQGGFRDALKSNLRHNSVFSMGTDLGDFDNDGLVDLLSMDMLPSSNFRQKASKTTNPLSRYLNIVQSGIIEPVTRNTLQRNNGNGTFSDVACLAGIFQTDWAWSCLLADLDNDGWKDLHITNGYKKDVNDRDFHDFTTPDFTKNKKISALSGEEKIALTNMAPSYKSRNFIYQNKGDWTFEDQGGKWATMSPSWSCGAAWADFDKDGDLDLVVNNLEEPAFVYKNLCREQGKGNFFQLKLVGNATNPLAVGASVLIEYGGQKQYQELYPNRGIFSTVEHLVHFGIGAASTVEKVSVRWPDGSLQILTQVTANQRLELKYQTGLPKVKHLSEVPSQGLIFEEVTAGSGVNFRHIENPFTDFEQWPLNLWSLTDLGPLAVVGDANGDGLEDVFIGNSFDQPGAIFAQQKTGKFVRISQAVFEKYKNYEDHGGLFFDADADGDQDLFLCSGGMDASSELAWQFRLFINDGKGNFDNETVERLPVTKDIGLRAAAHDYDGDGDLDLFIGGRVQPKQWPLTPRSVVLQNNQGKFTDVTAQVGGDFERCGMVTDLQWLDLDGNGKKELVVVGEWMPVGIFVLEGGKLREKGQSLGFEGSNGLWNRLCAADLDKDGDMDLVTGNLGLNTRYKASQSAPFLCYAKDFDNNGTLDPVAAVYEGNICYPLLQKDVFQKQMPSLKKRFLKNHDFARATVDDLFPKADLAASLQLRAYTVQSCWWENRAGKFVRHELPIQAQVSVVQGIVAQDFNKDGHLDLLLAGNRYGFEVETNRADAGTGALFLGDGKGGFRWLDNRMSGFWAMEEARDLALLRAANGEALIVVPNNNRNAQVFRCK